MTTTKTITSTIIKTITITTITITKMTITIKMPANFNKPMCINYYKVH